MKALHRLHDVLELWRVMLPHCQEPQPRQVALWTNRFADELMERALMRTARRFSPERGVLPEPTVVHKYVTGLLLNLEREARGVADGTRKTN